MRYFLDMNIPIYFCMEIENPLEKKAKLFVNNKKDIFLLCDYIVSINIPKWLKRQKVILFEFNQKIQNNNYTLFSSNQSRILFSQDKIFINKLILNYEKSNDKPKFLEDINKIFNLLQIRISYFIKKYIDEVVIPNNKIDFELKSCLFTWLTPNDSDAKTIASAIQAHNKDKLTIITSDKSHWTKELLNEVHNKTSLSKKFPSLPKIKYLQDYTPTR